MTWRQQEAVIREKRTIEAMKKNYMGPTGKFGIIAKYMGQPVIKQGGSMYDTSYLEDPYEDKSNEEYETTLSGQEGPLMYRDEIAEGDDHLINLEGYVFDGLSSGIHMDITYWIDSSRLNVNYKGYVAYKEIAGELEAFHPLQEWEDLIERLYLVAKKRMKKTKAKEEEAMVEQVEEVKKGFLYRLRKLWGV